MEVSLVKKRKEAFATLVMAYLKFNVDSITSVEVMSADALKINGKEFKFDVDDYTGAPVEQGYVFFRSSSGRLVIESRSCAKVVKKVYKLEVDLVDY